MVKFAMGRARRDITGQRFGHLTAISDVGQTERQARLWHCACDCPSGLCLKVRTVTSSDLIKGHIWHCGAYRKPYQKRGPQVDRVGTVSGKLTITEFVRMDSTFSIWRAVCECGGIWEGRFSPSQPPQSCSALHHKQEVAKRAARSRKTRAYPSIEGLIGTVIANYSYSRRRKSGELVTIPFLLTRGEVRSLIFSNCYLCGDPPARIVSPSYKEWPVNGIDRMHNDQPYKMPNCFPCCWPCNELKGNRDPYEFIDRIHKIAVHLEGNASEAPHAPKISSARRQKMAQLRDQL